MERRHIEPADSIPTPVVTRADEISKRQVEGLRRLAMASSITFAACADSSAPARQRAADQKETSVLIAGLGERYDCESSKAIPSQWQRFVPSLGTVPGQVGRADGEWQ